MQRLVRTEMYTKDAVKTLATVYEYDVLDRKIAFYEVDATCEPTIAQLEAVKVSYKYDIDGNNTSISYANNEDITSLNYYVYQNTPYEW